MEPALHNGSRHLLIRNSYETTFKGETVGYVNDFTHQPTGHRIVGGWKGKWITKGDANPTVDRGYCTPANYIGEIIP